MYEKEKDGEKEAVQSVAHSSAEHHSHGWACLKPRTGNLVQFSHMEVGTKSVGSSSAFLGALAGAGW